MMTLGVLVAIAVAVMFLGIAFFVWNGVFDTLAAKVLPRFIINQEHYLTRVGTLVYVVLIASLPATLAMLTTLKLVAMMRSALNF